MSCRPDEANRIEDDCANPGAGGLRKVRWATAGAGKRGGLRVIDYFARGVRTFYMVYACTKSEQGDLTPAQTRQSGRLIREEFR
jgi:hypothetical protein